MKVGLGNFALLNAFSYYYGINQSLPNEDTAAACVDLALLHPNSHYYFGYIHTASTEKQAAYSSESPSKKKGARSLLEKASTKIA